MAETLIQIRGYISGLPSGSRSFEIDIANTTSPYVSEQIALQSGDNTLTKPANMIGVIIIPPSGSTSIKTLKGVTGDTGTRLHNTKPSVICLGSGGPIIITASATETAFTKLIWF